MPFYRPNVYLTFYKRLPKVKTAKQALHFYVFINFSSRPIFINLNKASSSPEKSKKN